MFLFQCEHCFFLCTYCGPTVKSFWLRTLESCYLLLCHGCFINIVWGSICHSRYYIKNILMFISIEIFEWMHVDSNCFSCLCLVHFMSNMFEPPFSLWLWLCTLHHPGLSFANWLQIEMTCFIHSWTSLIGVVSISMSGLILFYTQARRVMTNLLLSGFSMCSGNLLASDSLFIPATINIPSSRKVGIIVSLGGHSASISTCTAPIMIKTELIKLSMESCCPWLTYLPTAFRAYHPNLNFTGWTQ